MNLIYSEMEKLITTKNDRLNYPAKEELHEFFLLRRYLSLSLILMSHILTEITCLCQRVNITAVLQPLPSVYRTLYYSSNPKDNPLPAEMLVERAGYFSAERAG